MDIFITPPEFTMQISKPIFILLPWFRKSQYPQVSLNHQPSSSICFLITVNGPDQTIQSHMINTTCSPTAVQDILAIYK